MIKKDKMPEKDEALNNSIEDVSFEANEVMEDTSNEKKKESKKSKKSGLDKKIEDLELKCSETNDKYLRLYSEFDNYRKRTVKERLELTKTASEDVITSLLPVVDDFDRAMQAIPEDSANDEIFKGFQLIQNKLVKILEQKGLEPMNSQHKEFDTDFHEAITNIPAPTEDLKGKVVDVIEKGYLLNGKIIRFAKVVVGS